ncbi:MAG: DUF6470 family protein [Pygmaiobacter massiliensis]|uniref:DUF6470 family protein n=1 Tax=Pygmaiobacter massiliensis TaxID=1917873 RepID=UPI00289970DC|nr:DUF6470 family protein [Pygmaiobacter massiliensis]
MYPLIEIKTIPIEIEMKTTNAKLEYTRGIAEMEVSRDKGGLSIKSRPIRVNIDTFEARNSLSPTLARSIRQQAERGVQSAYEATATYAQQGQLLLKTKIGQELVSQFGADAQTKDLMTNVGIDFLPKGGANISWDLGEMNIRYDMDKLNFDWKFGTGDYQFTPGDIQISVTQRPDVVIKYVGGLIYVPPSADPNHESIDVKA